MKTKLASAVGLALLAASFTFGSSFACSEAPETTSSALQTVASDRNANVSERLDELLCAIYIDRDQPCITEAQRAEVDQPSSVISEIEPSSTDAARPAIESVDAIVVEITQTVTVVVPGQNINDIEEPTRTGSIALEPSDSQAPGASSAVREIEPFATDIPRPAIESVDAIEVEITQTVTVVVPGQKLDDNEELAHTGSIPPEHSATEPF